MVSCKRPLLPEPLPVPPPGPEAKAAAAGATAKAPANIAPTIILLDRILHPFSQGHPVRRGWRSPAFFAVRSVLLQGTKSLVRRSSVTFRLRIAEKPGGSWEWSDVG